MIPGLVFALLAIILLHILITAETSPPSSRHGGLSLAFVGDHDGDHLIDFVLQIDQILFDCF